MYMYIFDMRQAIPHFSHITPNNKRRLQDTSGKPPMRTATGIDTIHHENDTTLKAGYHTHPRMESSPRLALRTNEGSSLHTQLYDDCTYLWEWRRRIGYRINFQVCDESCSVVNMRQIIRCGEGKSKGIGFWGWESSYLDTF